MSQDKKHYISTAVKLALGALLVFYVLKSKMIDFNSVREIAFSPLNLLLGLAVLSFSAMLCAYRWYLLASCQGLSANKKTFGELTMIGNFFNTFLPGSVGGDFVKAWYIAGREPERKKRAVFSVFLDRVIGLTVILCYAGVTLLFFPSQALLPQMKFLSLSLWAITAASVIGALLIKPVFYFLARWIPEKIHSVVSPYLHNPRILIESIFLSFLSILSVTLYHVYLGNRLGIQLDWTTYFFIVPTAVTAAALPLLPGGIGVGQVAFYTLFLWAGYLQPQQGATLCTIVQIHILIFNCIGGVFYARFRRNPIQKMSWDEAQAVS